MSAAEIIPRRPGEYGHEQTRAALVGVVSHIAPTDAAWWLDGSRDNVRELAEALTWRDDGTPIEEWMTPVLERCAGSTKELFLEIVRELAGK